MAQTLQYHRNNPDLIDKFLFAMDESGNGQPQASKHELWDLLTVCVHSDFIPHIILDGIDECADGEEFVLDLFRSLQQTPSQNIQRKLRPKIYKLSPTKVALFSRPHLLRLSRLFGDNQLAVENRAFGDIIRFLTRKIRYLRDKKLLPASLDVDETTLRLAQRADGMFLWARLMINYLSSPALNASKRLQQINHAVKPEGLDAMCDRIIDMLLLQNPDERKLVRWIFMWLALSMQQLSAKELHATLQTMDPDGDPDIIDYEDFDNAVITMCSSLVERVGRNGIPGGKKSPKASDVQDSYRLIHLSAKEYLVSLSSKSARRLMGSPEELSLQASRSCLCYLSYHMPRTVAAAQNSQNPLSTKTVK
jgi:hypothetical protein